MIKVSYYPGCSIESTAKEYGESAEAICAALDVELKELDDWSCCGSSSAHVVNNRLAAALPARDLEIASKAGMDLVVPCAACFQRLKAAEKKLLSGKKVEGISGKYDGAIKIRHLADFVWEDIGDKNIASKMKKSLRGLNPVCYYGCLTVRPPGITDAKNPEDPRSMDGILNTLGADVKKWSYKTECCGGNLILTRPNIAARLIRVILDMAEEAGADCIVTGCPMCFSNLDSRQAEVSIEGGKQYATPIFYFSELMGLAFVEPSASKWFGRHLIDPRPLLRQKGLI
ncbi:CoB--CoM heterodisulfide reductase iron-sulfur subunit B family protein [Chloroflexota bacterium]